MKIITCILLRDSTSATGSLTVTLVNGDFHILGPLTIDALDGELLTAE